MSTDYKVLNVLSKQQVTSNLTKIGWSKNEVFKQSWELKGHI